MKKKIAILGSYLPRQCGIASFTYDLFHSLCKNENDCSVIAVNDENQKYDYPEEVRYEIRQNNLDSNIRAATFLNQNQFDVVYVQHEFGIYGGECGKYIIQILKRLKMPVISTLHTILDEPSEAQAKVIKKIAGYSSKIIVMSEIGKKMLAEIYGVDLQKIEVIGHGIPDPVSFKYQNYKKTWGIRNKKVMLTFGLLSKSKGIETVINAMPAIIRKNPNIVYIIVGATHPHVLKSEGESYREFLKNLVAENHLENHVMFIDRFVSQNELFEFLQISDIYVIPYLSEKQITSGTLAYAMATHNAVVSTPFWHAKEALANGKGILFNWRDSSGLAEIVNNLLNDRLLLRKYKDKATAYALKFKWKKIGTQYLNLVSKPAIRKIKQYSKIKKDAQFAAIEFKPLF